MTNNVLKETIEDLENKKRELTKAVEARIEFSFIFITIVVMISLYTFLLALMNNFNASDKQIYIISRSVEILFIFTNIWLVFRSKEPLSSFGLTLKNAKKSIVESLIISAILMILMAGLKIYLMKHLPAFSQVSVIEWKYVKWDYFTYILVAPLQEFVCRGVLQSSINRFLVGKYNWLWSVILTSSLFGVFHIHESVELGIVAIIGGVIWGWIFARHKTLIGVSICHFLIGNWIGVLGIWDIIVHSSS